jgi:hypothetical protein
VSIGVRFTVCSRYRNQLCPLNDLSTYARSTARHASRKSSWLSLIAGAADGEHSDSASDSATHAAAEPAVRQPDCGGGGGGAELAAAAARLRAVACGEAAGRAHRGLAQLIKESEVDAWWRGGGGRAAGLLRTRSEYSYQADLAARRRNKRWQYKPARSKWGRCATLGVMHVTRTLL